LPILCCLLLCLLQFSMISFSQKGMGKLTGKVTNASNNETLPGVSVAAKGTSRGVSTITDGTYILALPPGTYTISYSSSVYKKKEITGVVIKTRREHISRYYSWSGDKTIRGSFVVTANIIEKCALSGSYHDSGLFLFSYTRKKNNLLYKFRAEVPIYKCRPLLLIHPDWFFCSDAHSGKCFIVRSIGYFSGEFPHSFLAKRNHWKL